MKSPSKNAKNNRSQVVYLLYEALQVETLERLWSKQPETRADVLVVALTLDVETRLTQKNISFQSARDCKVVFPQLLTAQDAMIEKFFDGDTWAVFEYRGVDLRSTFQFMFRSYLHRVWYYGSLLVSFVEGHPRVKQFVLFAPSGIVSKVAGTLAEHEITVVIDCAKSVAEARGIEVVIIPGVRTSTVWNERIRLFLFELRRDAFGFFLWMWNTLVKSVQRPQRPRLVISDHWKNVQPVIELLPQGEVMFLDRVEMRNVPWRTLFKYRMQFVHSEDFLSRSMRLRAKNQALLLSKEWQKMREDMPKVFICRGHSFDRLLLCAIDDLVQGLKKLFDEIEGTYALYAQFRPDVVMLRASVSGQTHFSTLPLVAKQCSIPSLEIQHGLEYFGPGSLSREHTAEYIATYGPLVSKEMTVLGYSPEQVRAIGSPRFDGHQGNVIGEISEDPSRPPTILCVTPDIQPFEIFDSYSAEDYFVAIAQAVGNIANARVIIKARSMNLGKGLHAAIARAFTQVPYTVVSDESLPTLFARCDVIVSCYSTVVLEALQCGKPVIIPALNPIEAAMVRFHFAPYQAAGALAIADTQATLTETLVALATQPSARRIMQERAKAFLEANYCFDGLSSQRCAALITELAKKSSSTAVKTR